MREGPCSGRESGGLAQVDAAVGQMDQAIQQNAAMVEESTAAAARLTDATGDLAQRVAAFRLAAPAAAGHEPLRAVG